MIITSLKVSNFRQYLGEHEVEFSTQKDRNVSVVTGPNGAGKTGLFIALNWCLYGQGASNRGNLVNDEVLARRSESEPVFVEVRFRHEGTQYVARRELAQGTVGASPGELTLRQLESGGRSKAIPNPAQRVAEILPPDARRYFFFDGEAIRSMSTAGHEAEVVEAMRSVLKLQILERAVIHLGQVEKEFAGDLRETAEVDIEVKELVKNIEGIRSQIEAANEGIGRVQAELDENTRQVAQVEASLGAIEGVSKILSREHQIRVQLAAKEEHCKQLQGTLAELLTRSGPALALAAVKASQAILDEKRERGEIPSNIREQLIEDLLKDDMCICGRGLDAASRKALGERLTSVTSRDMEDRVILATGHISALHGVAEDIPTRIANALDEYENTRAEMDELQRELEGLRQDVAEELKGKASEEVIEQAQDLSRMRRRLTDRQGDLKFDLGRRGQIVSELEAEEARRREALQRTEGQGAAVEKEARRYELAAAARKAAEDLLLRFKTDMRERISKQTEEIFKELIWKKRQFEHVSILEDGRLDVVDRFKGSALSKLSDGELQVLSLSFIVAMSRATGEEAPLVIDAPFDRISKGTLDNISKKLPKLTDQLILLMIDSDDNARLRGSMKSHIGMEYRLNFDDDVGETTIEEVRT